MNALSKTASCIAVVLVCAASPAMAWDAHGHRTIAWLAMDKMQSKLPEEAVKGPLAFLFSESGRAQVGYQSGEPDRYRSIHIGQLTHINDPDHYIDLEKLDQFGLTLSTVPPELLSCDGVHFAVPMLNFKTWPSTGGVAASATPWMRPTTVCACDPVTSPPSMPLKFVALEDVPVTLML